MAKRSKAMKFYELRLNADDIDHLRYVLDREADMQQYLMDSPATKGQTTDEMLEDWVVARDMKVYALKIIQMIDKVYKPRRK
jgi:hypothetical protein